MTRNCDRCGTPYQAQRPQSRFCSSRCRVAAGKARNEGRPESLAPVTDLPAPQPGAIADAVRVELEAAGRDSTSLGRQALSLAQRIDSAQDTGSAVAALHRELRATMAEAMAGAAVAADRIDELKARRERRGA